MSLSQLRSLVLSDAPVPLPTSVEQSAVALPKDTAMPGKKQSALPMLGSESPNTQVAVQLPVIPKLAEQGEKGGGKPSVHKTRRDIFALETKSAGDAAAEKYISEREQKRSKMFDIPKHVKYNFSNDATVYFGGVRQVEGQNLALLKHGEVVAVLPIDEATLSRLKRVAVGDKIIVTAKGTIQTKGRSR